MSDTMVMLLASLRTAVLDVLLLAYTHLGPADIVQ